jgi:hypothetical protein
MLLFAMPASRSQSIHSLETVDFQFWTDYNYTAPLTKKFSLAGDVGLRGFISNNDWNQIYIRPGVRHNFNKYFGLAGSIAGFLVFNRDDYNLYELRFTADANVRWPDFKVLNVSWRVRMENRTFFFQGTDSIQQAINNNWRFRILASLNSKHFHVFSQLRAIYFQVQYEAFNTFGFDSEYEVFINQTRLHVIFGHRISSAFGYDLQYIWQSSRLTLEDELQTTQNLFRIRFYHRIQKKKKEIPKVN